MYGMRPSMSSWPPLVVLVAKMMKYTRNKGTKTNRNTTSSQRHLRKHFPPPRPAWKVRFFLESFRLNLVCKFSTAWISKELNSKNESRGKIDAKWKENDFGYFLFYLFPGLWRTFGYFICYLFSGFCRASNDQN